MPVRRSTIVLTYEENALIPSAGQAGVAGENEAVYLRFDIPAEMEGLNVKLQVVTAEGAFDESAYATAGRIEMPLRAAVLVPGWLRVLVRASDDTGVRLSAECTLWVQASPGLSNAVATAFPQDFEELQQKCESILNQSLDGGVLDVSSTLTGRWQVPQIALTSAARQSGTLVLPARLRAYLLDANGAIAGEVVGDGATAVKDLPLYLPRKADMALENVDNTADADKPLSSAMQAALLNIKAAVSKSVTNTNSMFFCGCDDSGAEQVRVKDGLQADLTFTASEAVSGLMVTSKNAQAVSNGDFSNGTMGWNLTYASVSGNALTATGTTETAHYIEQIDVLSAGHRYYLCCNANVGKGSLRIQFFASADGASFAQYDGNRIVGASGLSHLIVDVSASATNTCLRVSLENESQQKVYIPSGENATVAGAMAIDLGAASAPGPFYGKTADELAALFPGYIAPAATTLTLGDFAAGDTFTRENGVSHKNGVAVAAIGDYVQYLGGTVTFSAAGGVLPAVTSTYLTDVPGLIASMAG